MALITIQSSGLWGTIASWINSNFIQLDNADIKLGWRDNIMPFSSAKGRNTAEPAWADMGNGHHSYSFTTGEELFLPFHVQHDYAVGTKAYPHVHFLVTKPLNAGEQITWRFAYVIAKGHHQGESLTDPETVIDMTYTATGAEVAGEHLIVECSDLQAFSLIEVDALVSARVSLVSENVTGAIFGLTCDLHYQANMLNTLNKAPNFYGV